MLDVKYLRANVDAVKDSLKKRYSDLTLEGFLKTEEERRAILPKVEELRNRRNVVSEEIGKLKKNKEKVIDKQHKAKTEKQKFLDDEDKYTLGE